MVEVECGGFIFTSNFESGNMARVEQVQLPPKAPTIPGQATNNSDTPDYEFNIWTNPDCAGTEFENSNRSWFYFGIRGGTPFALVKLNLVNLNRQIKMYSQGMAPVFRILPGRGLWDRIRDKPTHTFEDNVFTVSFRYRTHENTRATTYFAFTFPYSYQDLMCSLRGFDKRFKNCPPPEKYLPGHSLGVNADDIYYHRELAINSLDGRRLDLLTITSHHGITPHHEPRLKNLFPDLDVPRPHIFVGKKVIFVSARVHPGEVPSSYVLNGLLESLLNREDLTSILLRRMYVFKIIPMLNPDGVARGHFRTDTRGVNLNRVYLNPSLTLHPTIYAARAVIKYAHFGQEIEDDILVSDGAVGSVSAETLPGQNVLEVHNNSQSVEESASVPSQSSQSSVHLSQATDSDPHILPKSEEMAEKDPESVPCSILQHADEEMLNSDDNTISQRSAEIALVEMDETKDKDIKFGPDALSIKKDSFCASFLTDTHEFPHEQQDLIETSKGPQEAEVNPGLEVQDNRDALEEKCIGHVVKKGPNHPLVCDENSVCEENKRRKDPRRKPLGSGPPKAMRLFSRPLFKNEDNAKEEEGTGSQYTGTSCSHNTGVIACQNTVKPSLDPSKSGLFLYMDMHGHASKKGIFMYGNHFDDLEQLVECMLLPKIMSINSQNFHFTACNFTERNMYLRDRRDGMSREGCGRVSVMKMTGLVRSYTLECNYNTGRMVNLLPPCVRDSGRMSVNPAYAVPPKYTPLVFEDVGRALGVSVLDLTNSNPCSRVPNSEYRSTNGIRDWLRNNCLSDSQLWTRMLHRPTRQQVGQSSSSHSIPGPSGHKPVHLTKSVLLSRISTELKALGEEYVRKEHLRLQRTASCSQLDGFETSNLQPKENIGPGQCSCRSRRCGESSTAQLKSSQSGVLQQRSKTLSATNLAGTSRKKLKSSVSGSVGPLRSSTKAKALRRAKTQDSPLPDLSNGGVGIAGVSDDTQNLDASNKSSSVTELCATPKRLKVSGKVGGVKSSFKQSAWVVKHIDGDEKPDVNPNSVPLSWSAKRNLPSQVLGTKTTILGKIDRSVTNETAKLRSGVLTKVKLVKKFSHSTTSNLGEGNQSQVDTTHSYVKLITKLPTSRDIGKPAPSETNKQNVVIPSDKDWVQTKGFIHNPSIKTSRLDLPVAGPSFTDPCAEQIAPNNVGSKLETKGKFSSSRSLEKGAKSRLLCPVRRRSSEGKKAWKKAVERKSSSAENSNHLTPQSSEVTDQ